MTVVHCRQRMMKVLGRGRSVFISWHSRGWGRQVSAVGMPQTPPTASWKTLPLLSPCLSFPHKMGLGPHSRSDTGLETPQQVSAG